MLRLSYRSAYAIAIAIAIAIVIGSAFASAPAAADPPPSDLSSSMQCDRASEPGRVRCTVEARITGGRTITWADVEILALPEFASALKGRIGPQDAISRDALGTRWALGLVARRAGQGEVKARVRVVACEPPRPGATQRCTPIVMDVRAQVTVG